MLRRLVLKHPLALLLPRVLGQSLGVHVGSQRVCARGTLPHLIVAMPGILGVIAQWVAILVVVIVVIIVVVIVIQFDLDGGTPATFGGPGGVLGSEFVQHLGLGVIVWLWG